MADFVLGRLRFHFKGDWVTGTVYIKDDCVKYGGNVYVVKENHTANADFYVDLAASKTEKFTSGQEFKGAWGGTTYYKVDEVVSWGGKNYICNTGHTSQASLYDDTAKWTEYNSGFAWKGNYANATAYKLNDVVKYGPSTYICTTQHTGGATLTDANWALFASGLEFEDSWVVGSNYQQGDVVTYGGYNYVAIRQNIGVVPYNNTLDWDILSTGFKQKGAYNNATAYNPGDLVIYGGHSFAAKIDTTGNAPDSTTHWELVVEGLTWKDAWSNATVYSPGDVVGHIANSYRCKLTHTSASATNDPVTDAAGVYWDLVAEGDSAAVLSTRGDILSRNATANFRLPIGPSGQVLKVNAEGLDPEWGYSGVVPNIFYVSKNGLDDTQTGRGTSLDKPWLTIKYALVRLEAAAQCNPLTFLTTTGATYEPTSGVMELTVGSHSILAGSYITMDSGAVTFTCAQDSHASNHSYPRSTDPHYNKPIAVDAVSATTITINVGVAPITHAHTFVSATSNAIKGGVPAYAHALLSANKEWLKDEMVAYAAQQVAINASTSGSIWYGFTYDVAKCERDIGYMIDALDHDMTYGGNCWIRAFTHMFWANDTYVGGPSGDTYKGGGATANNNARQVEVDIHNKLRDVINNYIFTNSAYSSLQSPVITTQTTTGNNAEGAADEFITAHVLIETNALVSNLSTLPARSLPIMPSRTLFIKSGTYDEQLPMAIPEGVAVMGDEMRSVTVRPGPGTSDDSTTPNNRSDMFQMTEKTTIRGVSMNGLIGQLASASSDGLQRPTETAGATRSGVAVALNPNGLVYLQSPFVQNAVHVSYSGAVGIKVDGGLQPMGYDSILANDFTQICDDGVGVWMKNAGRSEIVSVFTYYCHMGYLADSGGTIRAANCNNSYGEYGAVSSGVDPLEVPATGTVNNLSQQAVVGRVLAGHNTAGTGAIQRIEFEYAGNNYNHGVGATLGTFGAAHASRTQGSYVACTQDATTGSGTGLIVNIDIGSSGQVTAHLLISGGDAHVAADTISINDSQLGGGGAPALTFNVATIETATIAFSGAGASGAATLAINDGGVRHVDVTTVGENHITTTSSAQTGTATTITLALSDTNVTGFYNGMRLTITDGTGCGQTGVIQAHNGSTKVCTMVNEVASSGWDYFGGRSSAETSLNATTTYEIEPRIHFTGGGSPTRTALARVSVKSSKIQKIFVLDTGAGYSSAPTAIITDPNATTLGTATPVIGNGVVGQSTITVGGTGYKTATTTGTVSGDGYSNINPVGNSFVADGLSKAPKEGASFQFAHDGNTSYLVVAATNYQGQSKFTPSAATYDPITGVLVLTVGTHTLTVGQTIEIVNNSLTFTCAHDSHGSNHTYPRASDPASGKSLSITAIAATTLTVNVGVSSNTTAHLFVSSTANAVTGGLGQATIQCSPLITKSLTPPDNTAITFRDKYSNIRMTGHDFLDIGTGSFADTNYPTEEPLQASDADDEVVELDRGRVFYTSTDQDGNYRVGDLFKVHQATGKATLNAESFDLSGLQELSLGSVALGSFGATVSEFSTDGTLSGNSDNALVTEKAIRTYVETQLGGGSNNLTVNEILVGQLKLHSNILITTVTDGDFKVQTNGTGKILLEAQTQTAIVPTVDADIVNKTYADKYDAPAATALVYNSETGGLSHVVSTNYNVPSQTATFGNAAFWFAAGEAATLEIDANGHLQMNVS